MKKIKNTTGNILVCDLKRETASVKKRSKDAISAVLDRGWYVLGKELEAFEKEFAAYAGSSFAVGVASGTEALELSLTALGVGAGAEVIMPANTAIPTAMAVISAGALPRFVDVDKDTFNIKIEDIDRAVNEKTKAIIPVHLYGNPCRIEEILDIAKKRGLFVIEDACQAHGSSYKGRKSGTFGELGTFSFYPTKNLGCYGDGGMIITDDDKLAGKLRLLRNYGQSTRYKCEISGINSRLDEVQAAVLRIKLEHLDRFNSRRAGLAALYGKYLDGMDEVIVPSCAKENKHVFHLYVIRCKDRDGLKKHLFDNGVDTEIHYPMPLHMQEAFKYLGYKEGDLPNAEELSASILTLPMFPELKDAEVKKICACIKDFYKEA